MDNNKDNIKIFDQNITRRASITDSKFNFLEEQIP